MKKYYMSFVNFSEISNVTADEEQLKKSRDRMAELGLLTEKGNPSLSQINSIVLSVSSPFFDKLRKRLSRRSGGFQQVHDTFQKLNNRKEYLGFYLYLSILYGFLEWQVPERVAVLPAVPEAIKAFVGDFMSAFDHYMENNSSESEEAEENGTGEADI